jgi:hypothetical protein
MSRDEALEVRAAVRGMWTPGPRTLFIVLYMVAFFACLFVVGSVGYAQTSLVDALNSAASEVQGYKAPISLVIGGLIVISFAVWAGAALVRK